MSKIYSFREHDIIVSAEREHLMELCEILEQADVCNAWSDLAYQIRLAYDVDFRGEVES